MEFDSSIFESNLAQLRKKVNAENARSDSREYGDRYAIRQMIVKVSAWSYLYSKRRNGPSDAFKSLVERETNDETLNRLKGPLLASENAILAVTRVAEIMAATAQRHGALNRHYDDNIPLHRLCRAASRNHHVVAFINDSVKTGSIDYERTNMAIDELYASLDELRINWPRLALDLYEVLEGNKRPVRLAWYKLVTTGQKWTEIYQEVLK